MVVELRGGVAAAETSTSSVSWSGGGAAVLGGASLGHEAWTSRQDKLEELRDKDLLKVCN